jgi:hypothetical protein
MQVFRGGRRAFSASKNGGTIKSLPRLTGSRKAFGSLLAQDAALGGEEARFAERAWAMGATIFFLEILRRGVAYHTIARTAVMKAKAAQIERISTLTTDIIAQSPSI